MVSTQGLSQSNPEGVLPRIKYSVQPKASDKKPARATKTKIKTISGEAAREIRTLRRQNQKLKQANRRLRNQMVQNNRDLLMENRSLTEANQRLKKTNRRIYGQLKSSRPSRFFIPLLLFIATATVIVGFVKFSNRIKRSNLKKTNIEPTTK